MFELGSDALMGERNYLRHHGSLTSKNMNSMQGRFANRPNKTRIMSVRRTDTRPTSMMPKTAINFYNLRKGLYLKNGAQSVSRQASTGVMNTYKSGPTKSTGLLNAYGELAAADLDIGGGIATQSNLFHHRGGKKQRKSTGGRRGSKQPGNSWTGSAKATASRRGPGASHS